MIYSEYVAVALAMPSPPDSHSVARQRDKLFRRPFFARFWLQYFIFRCRKDKSKRFRLCIFTFEICFAISFFGGFDFLAVRMPYVCAKMSFCRHSQEIPLSFCSRFFLVIFNLCAGELLSQMRNARKLPRNEEKNRNHAAAYQAIASANRHAHIHTRAASTQHTQKRNEAHTQKLRNKM